MSTSPEHTNRPAGEHTNRLAGETSPYLLQHAHNPVDWYPWGEEALERARELDRPIFLSIGYAACHWCHVMERESFEDEQTAADLNAGFVAIKVDREERPDLDSIYMNAVQAMTRQGGWPMSVFLTPDGRPFYGGTYFPDVPRHGMPSFRQLLARITELWASQREDIEQTATNVAEHVRGEQAAPTRLAEQIAGDAAPDPALLLRGVVDSLQRDFDSVDGGWGGAPKFPQSITLELLLREHLRTSARDPLTLVEKTLDAMAAGGIYDHLGGGFARYATDKQWLVPHFEKMLYDNAQLARVYSHAAYVTGNDHYAYVARETLDFVTHELRNPPAGALPPASTRTPMARREPPIRGGRPRSERSWTMMRPSSRRPTASPRQATGKAARSSIGSAPTPRSRPSSVGRTMRSGRHWRSPACTCCALAMHAPSQPGMTRC